MDKPFQLITYDHVGSILKRDRFKSLHAASKEAKADSRCMGFTIIGPEGTKNWVWRYNPNTGRGVWRLLRYRFV